MSTTSANGRLVLVFAALSGPQPWPCHFCSREVRFTMETSGRGGHADSPVLHHIDGNHENNDSTNWAWAHHSCHTRHHKAGRALTPEHRIKLGAAQKDRPLTDAHKANIAQGQRDRWARKDQ